MVGGKHNFSWEAGGLALEFGAGNSCGELMSKKDANKSPSGCPPAIYGLHPVCPEPMEPFQVTIGGWLYGGI